jgi:hypothetical protein
MDQSDFTWDATPYTDPIPTPTARRRSPWSGNPAVVLRTTVFLLIAAVAILVLLPAAIAAQAAFAV